MKIAIIGLGLMGGSMALALRRNSFGKVFWGMDNSSENAQKALDLHIVDEIISIEEVNEADLVILATPVDVIKKLLTTVLDKISHSTYVTDLGSTKKICCEGIRNHPKRSQYIAAHPMAGTENSGPQAAFAELFLNKVAVICEEELSDKEGVRLIEKMYASLWMRVIKMSAKEHDQHLAYVSHLSHLTSFALGSTVLKIERDERRIFDMASTGFASTVRLAKSSPEMWAPIFEHNRENLLYALNAYTDNLKEIQKMLEKKEFKNIKAYMKKTNEIRRTLGKMD